MNPIVVTESPESDTADLESGESVVRHRVVVAPQHVAGASNGGSDTRICQRVVPNGIGAAIEDVESR